MARKVKQKQDQEAPVSSSRGHASYEENKRHSEITIHKIKLVEYEACTEIQKHGDIGTCALFVWGPGARPADHPLGARVARRDGAYNLSFHQPHSAFKEELYAIIKELGSKGLIVREKIQSWYTQ